MSSQNKYLNWITLIVALTFGGVIALTITLTEYKEYLRHGKFIKLTGTIKKIERKGNDNNLVTFSANYQNEIFERSFLTNKELAVKQITIGLNSKNHNDFFIQELEQNHFKNAKESLLAFFILVFLIVITVIFKVKIINMEDNLFGHSS